MKVWIVLALVGLSAAKPPKNLGGFEEFKRTFNKQYKDIAEETARKEIFAKNVEYINDHNLAADNGVHSFRLAVNQFTDWTNDEFRQRMNGYKPDPKSITPDVVYIGAYFDTLPDTVDWRDKGVVTPVKNQAQCGSCWAFSAVASLEGQHALSTGKLVSLSEQNLVDCSQAEGNEGCGGGYPEWAFQYVIDNKGIDTESSYPYKAIDEKCVYNNQTVGATIKAFTYIKSGSESALQSAVATVGPISVGIDASSMAFQFYTSGVYDDTQCGNKKENLDHGVTAVGYGTQDGKDYWLVKNSWDTTWGDKGYILMSRNKDNQCGIATDATYPTGAK